MEKWKYRIVRRDGGHEPQMLYTAGATGKDHWFPLTSTGHWLEPEAYSYGVITKHAPLATREEAKRAIVRAETINSDQPLMKVT